MTGGSVNYTYTKQTMVQIVDLKREKEREKRDLRMQIRTFLSSYNRIW